MKVRPRLELSKAHITLRVLLRAWLRRYLHCFEKQGLTTPVALVSRNKPSKISLPGDLGAQTRANPRWATQSKGMR
jgi:hypothetical protein